MDEWFQAARRSDLEIMRALVARGADIDAIDARGNTALFHAMAPFGGDQRLLDWLLEQGAATDVRNADGLDPVQYGYKGATAALEVNKVDFMADRIAQEVFRRRCKLHFGLWAITSADDPAAVGVRLTIGTDGIDTRYIPLQLANVEARDCAPRIALDGWHATEIVHVSLELTEDETATMVWSDSVMGPIDYRLKRPSYPETRSRRAFPEEYRFVDLVLAGRRDEADVELGRVYDHGRATALGRAAKVMFDTGRPQDAFALANRIAPSQALMRQNAFNHFFERCSTVAEFEGVIDGLGADVYGWERRGLEKLADAADALDVPGRAAVVASWPTTAYPPDDAITALLDSGEPNAAVTAAIDALGNIRSGLHGIQTTALLSSGLETLGGPSAAIRTALERIEATARRLNDYLTAETFAPLGIDGPPVMASVHQILALLPPELALPHSERLVALAAQAHENPRRRGRALAVAVHQTISSIGESAAMARVNGWLELARHLLEEQQQHRMAELLVTWGTSAAHQTLANQISARPSAS